MGTTKDEHVRDADDKRVFGVARDRAVDEQLSKQLDALRDAERRSVNSTANIRVS